VVLYPDLGRPPDTTEQPNNIRLLTTPETDQQGEPVWRSPQPQPLSMSGRHAGEIAWSPRGDWIACAGPGANGGVFLVDPTGQRPPTNIMTGEQGQDRTPGDLAWSPDGKYLAHPGKASEAGHELSLAVVDADGTYRGEFGFAGLRRQPRFGVPYPNAPCRCNWVPAK
jgi:Tol biopolymer transport system component